MQIFKNIIIGLLILIAFFALVGTTIVIASKITAATVAIAIGIAHVLWICYEIGYAITEK